MSMSASHYDVLEKATEEALAAQKKMNKALVQETVTLAAKGSAGVIGLSDTMNAIHAGRVKTLLVSEEFEHEGYRCTTCGFLTAQEIEKCPFCGGGFEMIDSAVEMAVQEALQKNAEVKVMVDIPQLEEIGHIAAILRY